MTREPTPDSLVKPKERAAMYVIYHRPLDSPGGYLVRQWVVHQSIVAPGRVVARDIASLDEARVHIPIGCTNIGRSYDDDPRIIEVWL